MKILNTVTGVLKTAVSSRGNFIPVGEMVEIYRMKNQADKQFTLFMTLDNKYQSVLIPFNNVDEIEYLI